MGFFNSLITGVTAAGNIGRALVSAYTNRKTTLSNGKTVVVADIVVGGGRFMHSDDNAEHKIKTYLANTTDMDLSFSMPEVSGGGAVEAVVNGMGKIAIDDFIGGDINPDTKVVIGPVGGLSNVEAGGVAGAAVKILLKNLTFGAGSVTVGSISFEGTLSGLAVTCGSIVLTGIVYLFARGRYGVAVENRQNIQPAANSEAGPLGATKYRFDINFQELGFKAGETLEELEIHFSADANALGYELRAARSEPLTDTEIECFKSIGIIAG